MFEPEAFANQMAAMQQQMTALQVQAQAAEQRAAAAEQRAAAAERAAGAGSPAAAAAADLVDTKLLSKPKSFSGNQDEWAGWSFKMLAYLGALDGNITSELMHAVTSPLGDVQNAKLPADAEDRLLALGRERLGVHEDRPSVLAFWWPRFQRIVRWFIEPR